MPSDEDDRERKHLDEVGHGNAADEAVRHRGRTGRLAADRPQEEQAWEQRHPQS